MKLSAIATALLASSASAANSTTNGTATTVSPTTSGCWDVSVEHDATYCIEGPICSGSGLEPSGSLCPVKGDVATADCHDYLPSYSGEGSCVLPVDATCQVIKTGAWGCVLSSSSSSSSAGDNSTDAGQGQTGSGSGSVSIDATVLAAEAATSSASLSAGAVCAIAVAAAAVAAVAGFALYKQHQKNSAEATERAYSQTFVDVVTP